MCCFFSCFYPYPFVAVFSPHPNLHACLHALEIENVKKQEENRSKQLERERKRREDEAAAAKVINQQNMIQNYVNKQLAEIHRLEEASQRAYHRNQPRRGDELFGKARIMRGELRQYMREHGMR